MKKALVFILLIVQVLFANFITTSASERSWIHTYGDLSILGTPAPSPSTSGANPSGDSPQIKQHSRHRRGDKKGRNNPKNIGTAPTKVAYYNQQGPTNVPRRL